MRTKVEIIRLIQTKKYAEAENLINSSQKELRLDDELIFYPPRCSRAELHRILQK